MRNGNISFRGDFAMTTKFSPLVEDQVKENPLRSRWGEYSVEFFPQRRIETETDFATKRDSDETRRIFTKTKTVRRTLLVINSEGIPSSYEMFASMSPPANREA